MKRIFLFIVTNLAVLLVLNIAARLLGVDRFLTGHGLHLGSLLVFAAIFGFGGSIISLLMSKTIAKMSVGAQVIEQPSSSTEYWLVQTVQRLAREAGIGVPEVAIYDSPEVNAFATGASRNSALVAVSTGLLMNMSREEAEAVLGHEVSHVANGDMVTLTLVQGVVNTFVIFLSRIAGYLFDSFLRKDDEESYGPGIGYFVVSMISELVLGILASFIVMWFSRVREYAADEGGARLAGTRNMIGALERLKAMHEPSRLPDQLAAFGIAPGGGTLSRLLMSHPPLDERIAALRARMG